MEKEAIIQVKNIVARYGDELILDRISFDVHKGEILVILGTSGCGKTTLLRHMVGLNRPISGRVFIDGDDITACDDTQLQKILKKVGILFQGSALIGSMTAAENVALPINRYLDFSKNARDNIVRIKLCIVNLSGFENFLPSELSGGMKKRAGLARALALNPKIMFLDEPTSGLDPVSSAQIEDLIIGINQRTQTTFVIITHKLESIFKVAQRVIMLDKSTKGIIAEGDPHYLKNHSTHLAVRQFFNREAS
ncbi:MAG TPA: ATP-binding cassette domain-containing protein [Desulfobacterales bacterium]|nr:ATP-binding cassette domain-containing protein [Desulfobacterales bacterium]